MKWPGCGPDVARMWPEYDLRTIDERFGFEPILSFIPLGKGKVFRPRII